MKANSIIGTEVGPQGITFHVKGAGAVTLDMSKLSLEVRDHAAIHGMVQRISDAAAIGRNPENGQPASPEDKLEAMARLVAYYETGTAEWSRVREAGPRGGFLFEALCRMYADKKPEQVREFLDGLSDKQQAALREDDAVAPIIAAIKAERQADKPKLDTKSLLAGL